MSAYDPSSPGLTVTVLGCGTMGIAILSGILTSLQDPSNRESFSEALPPRLPRHFIACVRSLLSAAKISSALGHHPSLTVYKSSNVRGVQQSDVVLLACKPHALAEILGEPGMREALSDKLLISILPGISTTKIEETLYPPLDYADHLSGRKQLKVDCTIVRAMPNAASIVRSSMTVIANNNPPLNPEQSALVNWIFQCIGEVTHLPASNMDAATALCGAGPAFFAVVMEAAIDGAVAMGLPRAEAQRMAAQAMKGTVEMVLAGDHPALVKDKVATPGGCTMGGLMVLEEGRVRGVVSRAVREAAVVAGQIGKGVQGVNGTRFGNGI